MNIIEDIDMIKEIADFSLVILGCHWAGVIKHLTSNEKFNFKKAFKQSLISGFTGSLIILFAQQYEQSMITVAGLAILGSYTGIETIDKFKSFIQKSNEQQK